MGTGMVLLSALLGLVLGALLWPVTTIALTIAHEGGHALTTSLMGGSVVAIGVKRDSGATFHVGLGPVGRFVVGLAGYLGPSAFGVVGALLLRAGYPTAVLWLSLFFLILALLQSINLLTAIQVIAVGGVLAAILRYASPGAQTFWAYTWIWTLLVGGFVDVLVLQRLRRKGPDTGSDVMALRKLTYLPASLWSGFFWLLTLAALVYGSGVLLGFVSVHSRH